uniref:Uncharacterized protein n=1 Tax=Clastoptera arizonana TaxID=38151 RepID=A0A1B6DK34_9HEMI
MMKSIVILMLVGASLAYYHKFHNTSGYVKQVLLYNAEAEKVSDKASDIIEDSFAYIGDVKAELVKIIQAERKTMFALKELFETKGGHYSSVAHDALCTVLHQLRDLEKVKYQVKLKEFRSVLDGINKVKHNWYVCKILNITEEDNYDINPLSLALLQLTGNSEEYENTTSNILDAK